MDKKEYTNYDVNNEIKELKEKGFDNQKKYEWKEDFKRLEKYYQLQLPKGF